MTVERVTTFNDPFYEETYSFEGVFFTLFFSYSMREDRWFLSLETESGERLFSEQKVVAGIDLFGTLTSILKPKGKLVCVPNGPNNIDPGFNDLIEGGACSLLYISSDDSFYNAAPS